jgi:hypothetical protein
MSLAKMLADALGLTDIDADRGAYYLGSTAPDIRAITRWDRERTHFFALDDFGHQDSVRSMFDAYPDLADRSKVSAGTASFLAGYLTHLVLDEGWISEVYRPLLAALTSRRQRGAMRWTASSNRDGPPPRKTGPRSTHVRRHRATALEVTIGLSTSKRCSAGESQSRLLAGASKTGSASATSPAALRA